MSSFKIFFSADNIRRFRSPKVLSFDDFVALMCKQYPSNFHPELRIQYTDSEGDKIDVNSQLEWEEMFQELKDQPIIKIHIVEGKTGNYFKDGPAPDPLYFYQSDAQNVQKPLENVEKIEHLKVGIPACLKELFPGKRILPHNIPTFLQACINVTNLSNGEVNLDIDISQLNTILTKEGIKALDALDYQKGKQLFASLCSLFPNDYLAYYNLACSESLLGNIDSAVQFLQKAIQLGYANIDHMLSDPDLKNIQEKAPALFKELVVLLSPTEKAPQKPTEPVVNPQKPTTEPVVINPIPTTPEPIPEPVPVTPEPEPVIPPDFLLTDSMLMDPSLLSSGRSKWINELNILHELGFISDSILIPILEANGGSVENTIQELLL